MNYQTALGYLATVIAFSSYIPYLRNTLLKKTKPHAFSWLIWALLTGIAFVAQVKGGAGSGAWVSGVAATICFLIGVIALVIGERKFTSFDFISLFGALVSILLWLITKRPLLSIFFVILVYLFGYLPTYRKAFHKPSEETVITFAMSALKYLIGIFALETLSLQTFLFPFSVFLMDITFVAMTLIRRSRLKHVPPQAL